MNNPVILVLLVAIQSFCLGVMVGAAILYSLYERMKK
jgi:hypothetical protein